MFGRKKKTQSAAVADTVSAPGSFSVKNGTGDICHLDTNWRDPPGSSWWRDFCRAAKHLSDGDMSVILGSLQVLKEGNSAQIMTTPDSANCNVMGRFSGLGLAQPGDMSDMSPEIAQTSAFWQIREGAERHFAKILLELRQIDPESFNWEERQNGQEQVAQIASQLTPEGVDQIGSVFSQFDNGAGIPEGQAIEEFFLAARRALFATHLGINEEASQQHGSTIRNWEVTGLGSVMVTQLLKNITDQPLH